MNRMLAEQRLVAHGHAGLPDLGSAAVDLMAAGRAVWSPKDLRYVPFDRWVLRLAMSPGSCWVRS